MMRNGAPGAQRMGGRAIQVAARLGVEPRQNESESFVLPLHHRAKINQVGEANYRGGSRAPE